jgi:hypothetical protein
MATHFNWWGVNDAELAAPAPPDAVDEPPKAHHVAHPVDVRDKSHYVPYGNDLPTIIPLENKGAREALIQQVVFHGLESKETPKRRQTWGRSPPIPVNFTDKHYDHKLGQFVLNFQRPPVIPAHEYGTLEVALIEPRGVGWTYKGKLTVLYADGKRYTAESVEVDVIAAAPDLE